METVVAVVGVVLVLVAVLSLRLLGRSRRPAAEGRDGLQRWVDHVTRGRDG